MCPSYSLRRLDRGKPWGFPLHICQFPQIGFSEHLYLSCAGYLWLCWLYWISVLISASQMTPSDPLPLHLSSKQVDRELLTVLLPALFLERKSDLASTVAALRTFSSSWLKTSIITSESSLLR